jgi:hypothetical protein
MRPRRGAEHWSSYTLVCCCDLLQLSHSAGLLSHIAEVLAALATGHQGRFKCIAVVGAEWCIGAGRAIGHAS